MESRFCFNLVAHTDIFLSTWATYLSPLQFLWIRCQHVVCYFILWFIVNKTKSIELTFPYNAFRRFSYIVLRFHDDLNSFLCIAVRRAIKMHKCEFWWKNSLDPLDNVFLKTLLIYFFRLFYSCCEIVKTCKKREWAIKNKSYPELTRISSLYYILKTYINLWNDPLYRWYILECISSIILDVYRNRYKLTIHNPLIILCYMKAHYVM